MRITPESTRRPRIIGCDYRHDDGSLCPARIVGEESERLDRVRWRAREQGWACNNPGPGRPASDLCPVHRGTSAAAAYVSRPGREREPVAEVGDEDYWIVKHTHDVHEAADLMSAKLREEYGCPGDGQGGYCPHHVSPEACRHEPRLGKAVQVWVRVVPALPNSWAESEGLNYTFNPAEPHSRGAFKAVEFR